MKPELRELLLDEMSALALGEWDRLMQLLEQKTECLQQMKPGSLDAEEAAFCWRRNREILHLCQLSEPTQRAYGPRR